MPRFRPPPLAIAIGFALGVALAPAVAPVAVVPMWVACACAILAAFATPRVPEMLLGIAVVLGLARGAPPELAVPEGITVDDRVADRVVGTIAGPIVQSPRGVGALLETADAAIWVWAREPLVPGERVAATGMVMRPPRARGPALPDHAAVLATRGAQLELTAWSIERLGDEPDLRALAWRWAERQQARWASAIAEAGGDTPGTAALRGIAIGDRARVPQALDDRWRDAGIFHVLSVSGLHLAVVAGLVYALLRRLVAASPLGGRVRPARCAAPPALAIAFAYTLVTGAEIATVRSTLVISVVLIAAMLDRPMRLVDALGLAALAVLVWRPADLHDPSFQLSFTAALVLALRPAGDGARTGVHKVRAWIAKGVAASLWVTLVTAPITAFHFQQVAAGGAIGNLILTPIVELVALPVALAGLVIDWDVPIAVAAWLVDVVDRGAGLLASVVPVGHVAIANAPLMAVLVAISLWLATRRQRNRADVIAWIVLCFAWSLGREPAPAGALRVTFVDVGQGDAAIVELPDGAVWLVDAGGNASARDPDAAAAPGRALGRILAAYGRDRVDLAILSHPHPDHYLGLASLDVPIAELWAAPEPEGSARGAPRGELPSFVDVAAQLVARGTRIVAPPLGLARSEAGVELYAWEPRYRATDDGAVMLAADPVRSVNDNSLVVELRYRGRAILFAGDIEAEGEHALVAAGLPHVDVVKVPHHGSPTSSSAELVAATRPSLAVISCGRANRFHFPAAGVVARWQEAGAEIARTDRDATITVTVDDLGAITVDRFATRSP